MRAHNYPKRPPRGILLSLGAHQPCFVNMLSRCCQHVVEDLPRIGYDLPTIFEEFRRIRSIFDRCLINTSSLCCFSRKWCYTKTKKTKTAAAMPPTRRQACLPPKILVGHRPSFWAYLEPPKCHFFNFVICESDILRFFCIFSDSPL